MALWYVWTCLKNGWVWTLPKLVVPTWVITSREKTWKAPGGWKPSLPFSLMVTDAQKAASAPILISSKSYLLQKCHRRSYMLHNLHLDSPSSSSAVLTKGNKQSQSLSGSDQSFISWLALTHIQTKERVFHFPAKKEMSAKGQFFNILTSCHCIQK